MKILQVGRYPPPYGGITIHIQRLAELCLSERVDCQIIDLYRHSSSEKPLPPFVVYSSRKFPKRILYLWQVLGKNKYDIVHMHVSAMGVLSWVGPLFVKRLNAKKKILTIHHGNFVGSYLQKNTVQKFLIRKTLSVFDVVVLPTAQLQNAILQEFQQIISRTTVISTFIQPKTLELVPSFSVFDQFIQGVHNDNTIQATILISGFGFHYYGFDLLLSALEELLLENLRFGVIINFYGPGDEEYKHNLTKQFKEVGASLVLEDLPPEQFHYVLKNCDLYVRPNLTDSCGVTVFEAAMLGVPAIASDVCSRPQGTLLHKTNDAISLAKQIKYAVQGLDDYTVTNTLTDDDGGGVLLDLYSALIS